MVATYITNLSMAVSSPRLDKYRPVGGTDLDMAVTYFWNIALSEALYPTLAALEVTLRNGIHDAMTTREGTEWWFYQAGLLEPQQLRSFAGARFELYRRKNHQPTAGQVVAELNLGFWTVLLSQPYHQSLWAPNHTALVKAVFPMLPRIPNNRHYVHQRCNDLRILRNRVMHHEPVWNGVRVGQGRLLALADLHRQVIEAIGWISPTIRDSIQQIDHFSDTHQHGRSRIEGDIRNRFNLP